MRKLVLVFGPLVGFAILACAGKDRSAPPAIVDVTVPKLDAAVAAAPPVDASPHTTSYTEDAINDYDAAEVLLHEHRWDEATKAYREVKRKFSYSRFATSAEIRIADIAFARASYDEAKTLYREWAEWHPADMRRAEVLERASTAECRALSRPACVDTYDAGL